MKEDDWKLAYRYETAGSGGEFGIRVLIGSRPDRSITEAEKSILGRHVDQMQKEILTERARSDPVRQEAGRRMVRELLACFPGGTAMYVEEIPNGYCSDWCCVHLPWLTVTTPRGRITVGWRKRVIEISWVDSCIQNTADELFPAEDVTKSGRMIHAWGLEKAREYLNVLLNGLALPAPGEKPA